MSLDEGLDDGQTESGAAILAVAGRIDTVKALENMRQMLRRDTDTGIGNGHHHLVPRHVQGNLHPTVVRSVLDGIGNQIEKNLTQAQFIAADADFLGNIRVQQDLDTLRFGKGPALQIKLLQQVTETQLLDGQRLLAGLALG